MLQSKTQVGARDRKITILREVITINSMNEEVATWETFASPWAKVTEDRGFESYKAEQVTASRNTIFDIRYLSGVTEEMKISYDQRTYNIVSVTSPDRKRSHLLKAFLEDEEAVEASGFSSGFSAGFR